MDNWEDYPVSEGNLTEMEYTPSKTKFSLWSPMAEEVKVMLYELGHVGDAYRSLQMQKSQNGTWVTVAHDNLKNKFYTFHVKQNGCWLGTKFFKNFENYNESTTNNILSEISNMLGLTKE